MEISDKFKKFIFKKLYKDLSNVEIIPYRDSIWFIDRENEHWYFEYQTSGTLWWRYYFFEDFFKIFSLESNVYQSIISEWVEEILNHKVETTKNFKLHFFKEVEEVLNCKVETTTGTWAVRKESVEEVLNCKVETTKRLHLVTRKRVEEVLKYKVERTKRLHLVTRKRVEEVLKYKVERTIRNLPSSINPVEEVLNYKVETASPKYMFFESRVEDALKGNS
jgi:hypothetical protein